MGIIWSLKSGNINFVGGRKAIKRLGRSDNFATLSPYGGFMKPRAEGELKPPIESLRVYTRWVLL